MGSLYSKISGSAGAGGNHQQQQQQTIDPKHPDTSVTGHADVSPADLTADVSLGLEVKVVNGESDDSHLVTSSSSPDTQQTSRRRISDLDEEEERTQDTDDTEPDDVQNASLAANGPTDETLNASQVSAGSSIATSPSGDVPVSANGHGDGHAKAESVATWAQVVAGMSSSSGEFVDCLTYS